MAAASFPYLCLQNVAPQDQGGLLCNAGTSDKPPLIALWNIFLGIRPRSQRSFLLVKNWNKNVKMSDGLGVKKNESVDQRNSWKNDYWYK